MFDIDATPIDPELLDFTGKNNLGKSGGRGLIFSQERGRYIKPMIPRGKVGIEMEYSLSVNSVGHQSQSSCWVTTLELSRWRLD